MRVPLEGNLESSWHFPEVRPLCCDRRPRRMSLFRFGRRLPKPRRSPKSPCNKVYHTFTLHVVSFFSLNNRCFILYDMGREQLASSAKPPRGAPGSGGAPCTSCLGGHSLAITLLSPLDGGHPEGRATPSLLHPVPGTARDTQ